MPLFELSTGSTGRGIVVDDSGRLVTVPDSGSGLFIYSFGETGRPLVIDASGRLIFSPLSEINTATASNVGAGSGVFAQKVGDDLQFKSLAAGSGIGITATSTEVEISSQRDYGEIVLTSEAGVSHTNTTFLPASGATALGLSRNFDMPQDGRLRYTGAQTKRFLISAILSARSRQFDHRIGGTVTSPLSGSGMIMTQDYANSNSVESTTISTIVDISQNDYILLENSLQAGSATITFEHMKLIATEV
jgi:hypothetical protein